MKASSCFSLMSILAITASFVILIEANSHQVEILLNLYYNYDGKDAASRNCDHYPDNPKCDYLFIICVGINCQYLKREIGPIFNAELISRPDIRLKINISGPLPNIIPVRVTVQDFDTLQHDDIDILRGFVTLTGNIGAIPDRLFGRKSVFYTRTRVICTEGYTGPQCHKAISSKQPQSLHYFWPEYAQDTNLLRVRLIRYINPGSRDLGNNSCDYWPLDSRCDYIFKLCLGIDSYDCSYNQSTHKTFIDANEDFYPHITIPLQFKDIIPKYIYLQMEVYDDEIIQSDVLVDIFDTKIDTRKASNPYNIIVQGLHTTAEFEITAICKYGKKCFGTH